MAYETVMALLDSCKGVEKDRQEAWAADRWLLGGKMFAMLGGDKTGRPVLTLKLPVDECELMRAAFPEVVIPGYNMNKQHWMSLYLDADLPVDAAEQMAQHAYDAFLQAMPKKFQAALHEQ